MPVSNLHTAISSDLNLCFSRVVSFSTVHQDVYHMELERRVNGNGQWKLRWKWKWCGKKPGNWMGNGNAGMGMGWNRSNCIGARQRVLVMISSKSVSICNRSHARRAIIAANNDFLREGTPLWCSRSRSQQRQKMLTRSSRLYAMVKAGGLYLSWAWIRTGTGQTDRITLAGKRLAPRAVARKVDWSTCETSVAFGWTRQTGISDNYMLNS